MENMGISFILKLIVIILFILTVIRAELKNERIFSIRHLNWTMAATGCKDSFNQVLLEMHNENDMESIKRDEISNLNRTYWLGLRYYKERNEFRWQNGRISNWSNWHPDQPVFAGDKPCVAMSTITSTWKAWNCSDELPYVCHDPPVTDVAVIETTSQPSQSIIILVLIYSSIVLVVTIVYIIISYLCIKTIKEDRFALPTVPPKIKHWPS